MNYETWGQGFPSYTNKNNSARTWFLAKITDAGGDNITTYPLYYGSPKSDDYGNPDPSGRYAYFIDFTSVKKQFATTLGNFAKQG